MESHRVLVPVVLAIISCLVLLSVGYARPMDAGMRAELTNGPIDSKLEAVPMQRDKRQDDDNDGSQDDSEDQDSDEDSNVSQDSKASQDDESEASQDNETSQDNESEYEQSQSEDGQSENSERNESQASQDSEASQDDESQGDEQSQDQDEQNQDSESRATEASQNDETQSSQDEDQSQGSENQGTEQSQSDESQASQDNEESQDNESDASQDEQSQDEHSQDNENQDNEQSESQASQDSEASQDDESQGSEDDEQSQDRDEQSQDSESRATEASQNDETQSSQDEEQSQDSENQSTEQSLSDESQASQDNEESQDNESDARQDEQSQDEHSQDNENQDNEQSESQASQDSEASQDDESQGSEDDEQSQDQDEQSQDSESRATEASQNDETQSSQDEEQSQGSENQGTEQSQSDESQASRDNEENQDNESDVSQDEQSQDEHSQDNENQDNEQSESQASQESESGQDDESQGSEDDEQSQDKDEQSQDSESQATEASQNDETQSSQDEEQSQNDESQDTQDGEQSQDQSQNEQSQATNQDGDQSQDNEESPEEESSTNHDEESQADGEESDASQESQDSEASENSEQSQDDNSAEESRDDASHGDASQDDSDESQDSDITQNLDNHTAPPDFEGTCAPDELLDLSEGATVGDVAVGHCESGLFEGKWICQYDSESRAARWVQIECDAPEDLEFAATAELIVADPVEAIETVLEHVNNHTLSLQVTASILERIMFVPAPTPKLLISDPYTADYMASVLCQLSSVLVGLNTLPKEERASAATKLLHTMDMFALKYVDSSKFGEIDCGSVKVDIKDIVPGVDVVGIRVGQNSIILPNSELRHSIGHSSVKAASFFFVDLSDILLDNATKSGSSVITPVISTALLCGNAICNTSSLELSRPVKITLERSVPATTNNSTKKSRERHNLCSFWRLLPNIYYPSTGAWSQRGCTINKAESTSRTAVCECNHLTHFAVLLSPGVEFGEKHEFALRTIGYIGITISLVAMAITVFINMCFRSLWSMRSYIHINLCLSLMAALLLFVMAIDKTGNKIGCSVVAIALHYLFLVSFMWMLMEGVVLYVLLVKVFVEGSQRKYIIQFTVLSYGLPALYMCVTVPLGFLLNGEWHYGSDEMCWLRYDTHFIWAFITPVILIIMINFGFFIMAMVVIHKHQHKKKDSGKFLAIRKWIKTAASLTSVMGLTWITGVVVFHKALIPVAYIFTIFVAFEGIAIFVLFVVVSKQVREALLVCVRDRVNDSEFLSEHIGTRLEKLTPNSTKSRRESTVQYYKNLQKQRRVSNESSKAPSQATLKLHYISTNTHGCVIYNEASVSGDSPSSCSAAVDAGVNDQEYETQTMEMIINDGETVY